VAGEGRNWRFLTEMHEQHPVTDRVHKMLHSLGFESPKSRTFQLARAGVGVMALAALNVLLNMLEIVVRLVGTTSIFSRVFALSAHAITLGRYGPIPDSGPKGFYHRGHGEHRERR
jgi:hypothetical protein